MANDRIAYLDLVKFIAILLVCIGHCYVMVPTIHSVVRPVIYSFHMPLFMLVCGYFSLRSLEFPLLNLLSKKFQQLLIPVTACTLVSILLFRGGQSELIGSVWFLRTLFLCYLIARISKYIKLPVEIVFLLSWIVLLFVPIGGTLMINFLYFYFGLGYLIHKYQDRIYKYGVLILIFSVIWFVIAIYKQWTVPCERVDWVFLTHFPFKFIIQILTGFSGSILIIGCCKLANNLFVWNKTLNNILSKLSLIGRYTLGIYVVQTFLIERLLTAYIKLNNDSISPVLIDFILIPLIGLILCIICCYIVRITQRYKIINLLFYGGQKY